MTIAKSLGSALAVGCAALLTLKPSAWPANLLNKPQERLWVTDGSVHAMVETNGTLYLGGQFHYVGPNTGSAAAVSALSGAALPGFPAVNGPVYCIVSDGVGGWFIGGSFSAVGSVSRPSLAHVLSSGNVDTNWAPQGALGKVNALALSGSTLYVGGQFYFVNGQVRTHLAAVDVSTGDVLPWNPTAAGPVSSEIRALAVSGTTVYVGGVFNSISSVARTNIAAVDATSGTVLNWNPGANFAVNALLSSGQRVYAGGSFTRVGGLNFSNVVALDTGTGNPIAWPSNNANGTVTALALSGSTLFVGGTFTRIGGASSRLGLAALNVDTGAALSWNPGQSTVVGNSNAVGIVRSLVVSGSTVYVGGHFTVCGGEVRSYAAALDASNGSVLPWNPGANFDLYCLAVTNGTVLAGGEFMSFGGVVRSNLAALDLTTGTATSWAPATEYAGSVNALAVDGTRVYVGGNFTSLNGVARRSLGAVQRTTGTLDNTWNPNSPSAIVRAVLLSDTNVIVGGSFVTIGGQNRTNIAALGAATAQATSWSPNANLAGQVYCLAQSGSVIYAGGDFTSIGGANRARIAAVDASTGLATPWNPGADGTVRAIAPGPSRFYAGGTFQNIGGQNRALVAALDPISGSAATNWNAMLSAVTAFEVNAVVLADASVYVGGSFASPSIGGLGRWAELDSATGAASSWNPVEINAYFPYLGSVNTGEAIAVTSTAAYFAGTYPGYVAAYDFPAPASRPQLILPSYDHGVFHCQLIGENGRQHTVEYSSDGVNWYFLGTFIPSGGVADVTDATAPPEYRFYRAWTQQ